MPIVRRLEGIGPRELGGLCELLIDCVEGGASVNFMWPMTRAKAELFWQGVAASLARAERAVIVAEDDRGQLMGTAQAVWAPQENQPHRAEIAKMLVRRNARRTLLVLDTASADAERLYERAGWQRVGTIPRYALLPDGAFCQTVVFYKDLLAH